MLKGQNDGQTALPQSICTRLVHTARVSTLCVPMEGVFNSKGAIKMSAVKSFQGGNHNKKVPLKFAHSPLPIESFLHLQTWHTRYPSQAYALEFNVSFAGVKSIAFHVATLCQQRWNTGVNWNQMIADFELLNMYGRRQDLETTLQAMGLDHRKLPKRCDPGYRHTVATDEEVAQLAHEQHMQALMSGQAPPNIGSQASSSQAPPQSSSAVSQ